LADNEICVYGDAAHAIQHQKVIIIDPDKDDSVFLVGSFNFTAAAEFHNSEDIAVLRSHELASVAERNWILHKDHSKAYAEFVPPERDSKLEKLWKSMKGILIGVTFGVFFVLLVRHLAKK
jgi:phosphatidylserine/phosphatidylglycerophosphate/cardiolipin synthase-like enzyme